MTHRVDDSGAETTVTAIGADRARALLLAGALLLAAAFGGLMAFADGPDAHCGYGGYGYSYGYSYCAPSGSPAGTGSIAGRVTQVGTGAAVPFANVNVRDVVNNVTRSVSTDGDGKYSVGALPASQFTVQVSRYGHATRWYDGADVVGDATVINLLDGEAATLIDVQLQTVGLTISGTVTDATNAPVEGMCVTPFLIPDMGDPVPPPSAGPFCPGGLTGPTGQYSMGGFVAGPYTYILRASDSQSRYATEYYQDKPNAATATHVTPPTVANFVVGPFTDSDGVEDSVENAAPNGGDGNGDGILDSLQSNVTSLLSENGSGPYVTIVSPPGTTLDAVTTAPDPGTAPVPLPLGLIDFAVQGAPASPAVVDVKVYVPSGMNVSGWWKYQNSTWTDFTADADISGNPIVLHLVDNGPGDEALAVGVIHDPSGPTSPVGDTTKPTVVCPSPPTFKLKQAGAVVTATVTDSDSGPDPASGSAIANTATVGSGTVAVTGRDLAGNETTVSCAYKVVYDFKGFIFPVNDLRLNKAKAGLIIPVSWRITDAKGVGVSNPASFVSLTSSTIACPNAPGDDIEVYSPIALNLVHVGGGVWVYFWKTPKTFAGQCRQMQLNLADGTTKTANFKFK